MSARRIQGLENLRSLIGQRLGTSEWFEVTQERVNAFADGTGDHQWIHCDPERARRESPYGTTVAHGYLTLSLGPALTQEIYQIDDVKLVLNYGLNRVRFPNAVKVGQRVRLSVDLMELKETATGVQGAFKLTFEIEGESKPACVAESLVRMFF
jgi:acyl dehydratase